MTCSIDFRKIIIIAVVILFIWVGKVSANDTPIKNSQEKLSYKLWYAKFAKGTCTDYAASRRKDLFPSRNGHDRTFWWNAISWLSHAKKSWIPTGKKPSVWSIAVFWAWRGAWSSYGHVAIVEKIIDNNTIIVSDMNYAWRNKITTRTISSKLALWYIYKLSTADSEKSETKQTIKIELSLWANENHTTVWSLYNSDWTWISLPLTKAIVYKTPIHNWRWSNNTSDAILREMIIVADNKYIMKYLSHQTNNSNIWWNENIYYNV